MRFEYCALQIDLTPEQSDMLTPKVGFKTDGSDVDPGPRGVVAIEAFNELGGQGWEIVRLDRPAPRTLVGWFKRALPDDSARQAESRKRR